MNFVESADSVEHALRKMNSVSRSFVGTEPRKSGSFFMESVPGNYRGPFMAQKIDNFIRIASPAEFMGGNTGYAGSICAPDMQILKHVESIDVSFTEGQENTLFCLAVTWLDDGLIDVNSGFYPDPWKTCSDTDRLITADAVNPKTEEDPARDPFLSIYPIFRMEGSKIVQIQQGHIVEYNRWWRS